MKRLIIACALLLALPATAQTVYITDSFTVPLRSGPSNAHRILHRGLPSGTALVVIGQDEASGFSEVRMQDGTEGWLPTQYLVSEPVARARVEAATRRASNLQGELAELRSRHEALQADATGAESSAAALQAEVRRLQAELAEVRQVSAEALEQHAELERLQALNQRLRTEVGTLVDELRDLESNLQQRWLLTGAGLVLGGLLLGVWLKSRSRPGGWA